jgi:hypothetical protein
MKYTGWCQNDCNVCACGQVRIFLDVFEDGFAVVEPVDERVDSISEKIVT